MSDPPPISPLPSRCTSCGYPLAGLAPNLPCPECGCADPLDPAPIFLRQLRRGLWIAALGTILISVPVFLPAAGLDSIPLLIAVLILGICVLSIGAWIAGTVLARAPRLTVIVHFTLFTLISIPALGLCWFFLLLMNAAPVGEMLLWFIPVFFFTFLAMSAWCLFRIAGGIGPRARVIRVGLLGATYFLGAIAPVAVMLVQPFASNITPILVPCLALCALLAIADLLLGLKQLPKLD